jgi:transcription initiation factor TFIIIB Brf1 subunit/transcription initiation factor TFIIB
VLTDDGQQGMRGKVGIGSSSEQHQGQVAAAIYANCAQLNNRQLDEIVEWVRIYKK